MYMIISGTLFAILNSLDIQKIYIQYTLTYTYGYYNNIICTESNNVPTYLL